ncbi:MAG: KTSC domain-containing protein [Candidatus Pacearchaeota archaeon]|jgi:hypothetical protein|nr:KTSC domain-containing protein [Clostridia bacterium]
MAAVINYHQSSTIESSTYDSQTQILTIEFKNGSEYAYSGVDLDTYEGLVAAASTGVYFQQHIKNSFSYTKA